MTRGERIAAAWARAIASALLCFGGIWMLWASTGDWRVPAGVFLLVWGNNIGNRSERDR